MESQELDPDRSSRLSSARAEFIASLGRRIEALRGALSGLEQDNRSRSRRDNLMRRVHAMGAAARVLGFAAVAEALAAAEAALHRSAGREVSVSDLAEVSRAFDQLPSLVWGIASTAPAAPHEKEPGEDRGWPLSVLVFGGAALAEGLRELGPSGAPIETERTEELERARDLARIVGPDIVVLDVDRRGARDLAHDVLHDPQMEPAPLIVLGTFDTPQSAADLVALGATRVLPKPVSPDTLRRTILEASQLLSPQRGLQEPLGEVTIEGLSERIAAEVRRGLIDAVEPLGREAKVVLGEGTDVLAAVWASVARVRELVTLRSGGAVRFDAAGPEGAIPLAPWSGGERRAGERGARDARDGDRVSLEGRTAVVADDDPAVVWFIGGLLRAVGTQSVEAHDGRRALELAYETWPDLVVSDLLMPGLDGFSLCREIKRDVAIRDVPVIVLSWKEDLLQRMRELGADADGYLRKEASASTVVQRVREVLRPRARVEARLKAGGEVRGRLDGLTPRLVLQLTCAHRPDARVSIRDAVYLYEVQIRDGQPRCATRTASDGGFERGEGVLGALLGASAGRFAVTPDRSACRRDFEGSLEQVLKGPISRARAAQRALSAERFVRVERVEIDETAILAYVASTPEPARSMVQRLLQGTAPRELVMTGEVSPRLLDLVLGDIARHGAVLAVEGAEGADLLARAADELKPAPEPVRSVPPPPTPPPGPQFTMQLSPGPPEVSDLRAAVAAPVVMTFGAPPTPEPPRGDLPPVAAFASPVSPSPPSRPTASPGLPLSREMTPFVPAQETPGVLAEGAWSGAEPSTLPGVGATLPAPVPRPEPASRTPEPASRTPEPRTPTPARALTPAPKLTPAPSPSAAARQADPFAATLNIARREILESPLPARMRVSSRPSAPTLEPEHGGVDLDRAVLDALEESWSSPQPATADKSEAPPAETKSGSKSLPPLPKTDAVEEAASAPLAMVAQPPRPSSPEPPRAAEPEQAATPEPEPAAVAAPEPEPAPAAAQVEPDSAPAAELPAKAPPVSEGESAVATAVESEAQAAIPRPKTQTLRMDVGELESDPAARIRSDPPPLPGSEVPPKVVDPEPSEPVKPRERSSKAPRADKAQKKPGDKAQKKPAAEPAARKAQPEQAVPEEPRRSVVGGVFALLGFAAAAVGSFVVVSWIRSSDQRPPAATVSAPALAAPAPAPSASAARPAAPAVEDLELPAGVPVPAGKGLLEVDVGGKQAIYVDSVFVGRGPLRRVPLDPGRHDVMLRLDADEMIQVVEVRPGRRTRLSLAAAP